MRRSLVASWLLAGVAVALLITAGVMWLTSSPGEVGNTSRVESSLSPPNPSTTPSTLDTEAGTNNTDTARSVIPANEASLLEDVASDDAPVPVHLSIGSIDVTAPIVPTGVDSDTRLMQVPDNVEEVAWYRHGPVPGAAGSAVLAAHVDVAGQGPGVFFRLDEVVPGDRVIVSFDDGSVRVFSVEGRTRYLKTDLPLQSIFSREGPPVLTLITCGGVFDESARSYDSNIVVYAVPETSGDEMGASEGSRG